MFRPNSAITADTVFQPDYGRIRPKHVVGDLLYL